MSREAADPRRGTIASAQRGLEDAGREAAHVAARGRAVSRYAWGSLFAAILGASLLSILLVLTPVTTETGSASSTVSTAAPPLWAVAVSIAPSIVLWALAAREIFIGRREASRGLSLPPAAPSVFDPSQPAGIDGVRRAQEALTKTATSIEWSFVPLALGLISLVSFLASELASLYAPGLEASAWYLPPVAGLVVAAMLLWPVYRASNQWMSAAQAAFDRRAEEMTRLEAEFLWRFAGPPA